MNLIKTHMIPALVVLYAATAPAQFAPTGPGRPTWPDTKPNQVAIAVPAWTKYFFVNEDMAGLLKNPDFEGPCLVMPMPGEENDPGGHNSGRYTWSNLLPRMAETTKATIYPGRGYPMLEQNDEYTRICWNHSNLGAFYPWVLCGADDCSVSAITPVDVRHSHHVAREGDASFLISVRQDGKFKGYAFLNYTNSKSQNYIYIGGIADGKIVFGNAISFGTYAVEDMRGIDFELNDGRPCALRFGPDMAYAPVETSGNETLAMPGGEVTDNDSRSLQLDFNKLTDEQIQQLISLSKPAEYECVVCGPAKGNGCTLWFVKTSAYPRPMKWYRLYTPN